MIFIGIDPGMSGGVAILHKRAVNVIPMSIGGKEIDCKTLADWIYGVAQYLDDDAIAYLEKVSAMPGQGVSSTFKFGASYGMMLGILGAMNIPHYLVAPSTWKSAVLKDLPHDKDGAIDYCRRAYPDVSLLATSQSRKAHSGMADALCIAAYASLRHRHE